MNLFGRGPRPHRHSRLGFEIQAPPRSEIAEDVGGMALVIAEPPMESEDFRANVVVTAESVPPGSDIETHTQTPRSPHSSAYWIRCI
jgi:hypothetical protein